METVSCSVFDERLDAQCAVLATMVRTVMKDGEFPTCSYYCREHGDAHGAVTIAVAQDIRCLRARALRDIDEHLVNASDRALLGDELAIDECMDAIAQTDAR